MSYKELTVRFYENGKIEYCNKAGQLHNDNGPAIVYADGEKYWYINDEELTEVEFNARRVRLIHFAA